MAFISLDLSIQHKHFPCEILVSVNNFKLYQAQQDADFVNYGPHKSEKRKKKCVLANNLWLTSQRVCSVLKIRSMLCLLLTVTKKGNEKSARTLLTECYRSPLFTESSTWMQLKLVSVMTIYTQVCKIGSIKSNITAIISDRCTCNLALLTLIAESSFRHFLRANKKQSNVLYA